MRYDGSQAPFFALGNLEERSFYLIVVKEQIDKKSSLKSLMC
jgi:hypothetical protein